MGPKNGHRELAQRSDRKLNLWILYQKFIFFYKECFSSFHTYYWDLRNQMLARMYAEEDWLYQKWMLIESRIIVKLNTPKVSATNRLVMILWMLFPEAFSKYLLSFFAWFYCTSTSVWIESFNEPNMKLKFKWNLILDGLDMQKIPTALCNSA